MRSETCICHLAEGLQKWPCSVACSGIHIVVSISTRGPGSPRGADPVHTRQARGRASRGRERPCLSHTCDSPLGHDVESEVESELGFSNYVDFKMTGLSIEPRSSQ